MITDRVEVEEMIILMTLLNDNVNSKAVILLQW